jgi:LPS sulfotransferase NodH
LKKLRNTIPFFKYQDYTPFLIIGHPRTGTSLLHTYLNSHANVLSLNEPLSYTTDGKALFKAYATFIKVVGFKYFHEYVLDIKKKNVLVQLITDHKIKVIKIHRQNYLRTYVSLCIAEKTKEWSSTSDRSTSLLNKQLYLTKDECILAFDNYKNLELSVEVLLAQYQTPVHEIDYEELVASPNKVMNGVYAFLGLSAHKPFSLLKRQNPEQLSALIVNYSALKMAFIGSDYEAYFED